jgi:hypothetical protein
VRWVRVTCAGLTIVIITSTPSVRSKVGAAPVFRADHAAASFEAGHYASPLFTGSRRPRPDGSHPLARVKGLDTAGDDDIVRVEPVRDDGPVGIKAQDVDGSQRNGGRRGIDDPECRRLPGPGESTRRNRDDRRREQFDRPDDGSIPAAWLPEDFAG